MKSNWSVLKNYINSKNIEDIIERENYIHEIEDFLTDTSFNKYCKCLSEVLILYDLGNGKYSIIKKIPDELTTAKLFRILNDKTWRKWFIPIEDRLKII